MDEIGNNINETDIGLSDDLKYDEEFFSQKFIYVFVPEWYSEDHQLMRPTKCFFRIVSRIFDLRFLINVTDKTNLYSIQTWNYLSENTSKYEIIKVADVYLLVEL